MENQRDKFEAWKYLVDDFLEMACFLNETERGFLIEKMALSGETAKEILSRTAFSMSGKLITLAEKENIEELWIYDAPKKEVRCFKLSETPEKRVLIGGQNHSNIDLKMRKIES